MIKQNRKVKKAKLVSLSGDSSSASDLFNDIALSKDDAKDEYMDVSNNQRHWGVMRFHSLTVFIATMGGLLAVLFQAGQVLANQILPVLKLGGILIVIVFWTMDERIFMYWNGCIDRAIDLEKKLGFRQYTNRPPRGIITSRSAIRLLFLMFLLFWVINLAWG